MLVWFSQIQYGLTTHLCFKFTSTLCDVGSVRVKTNAYMCLNYNWGQSKTGGAPLENQGAHLLSGGGRKQNLFLFLRIEKQNRKAALTRVLKGCVKATDWGTKGGGEMTIKFQSKICLRSQMVKWGWTILSLMLQIQYYINVTSNKNILKYKVIGSVDRPSLYCRRRIPKQDR